MNGIPVLHVEGDCIARAWEQSLVELCQHGCVISRPSTTSPTTRPARTPRCSSRSPIRSREPMIHQDFPGGFEELQEYVMEVCEGIKDHCVRDPDDPTDTRWEYTYHQRLFAYRVPDLDADRPDRDGVCQKLAETPHTRRAQAITWKVWEDNDCYDPACLQSVWCRITEDRTASRCSA